MTVKPLEGTAHLELLNTLNASMTRIEQLLKNTNTKLKEIEERIKSQI